MCKPRYLLQIIFIIISLKEVNFYFPYYHNSIKLST